MTTNDPPPPVCPRCGTSLKNDAPEGLCPRCLAAINFETGSLFSATGASLPPPPIEEIAPHFPQLEILSCLGRGGMGVVYKARQISLDRLVALKLLAPEREKDPEFSERFAREAQALAKMSHPHIVTVHDFGQAGGFFYLLMEYVDGANLRQLLQSHKFTPEQALAVVPPLCDALQYAHDRGIVHRDIKPENLLMDRDGRLKVADFGLAKMLDQHVAGDERPVGTPSYMAPEQTGDPVNVDNRADIYSLGVVIYEMLTGELPGKNFQPPSSKVAIDARLDEVVMRAMEQEPDQRYQQASILKTEVENITQAPPVVPPVPQPAPVVEKVISPKVREDVTLPAVVMMVASGLAIGSQLLGTLFILFLRLFPSSMMNRLPSPFSGSPFGASFGGMANLLVITAGGWLLFSTGLNIVAFIGAYRMRKMESHPWAVASAVILIAMGVLSLPGIISGSFGGLISLAQLGAGIWGITVLMRDEVKAAFGNPSLAVKSAPSPVPASLDEVKRKLVIPSIGLMVAAGLNLLLFCLMILVFLFVSIHQGAPRIAIWVPILIVLFVTIPSVITFIGAWKMRGMKGYTLAIIAAVLALITPPGLLIGVIFGIWALVVLFDKDVKAAFQSGDPDAANKGCLVAAGVVAAILLLGVLALAAAFFLLRVQRVNTVVPVQPAIPEFQGNMIPQFTPPVSPMPVPPAVPAGPSDDLTARYEASRMISDFTVRNSILAEIGKDAAAAGNVSVSKQALAGISDFTLRNQARKAAALLLCDRGLRKDAVEISRLITDFTLRDETLKELSTRKPAAEAMPEP